MKIIVKDLINVINGKLVNGKDEIILENYSTDTRNIKENDTFIGIKGESFNGNLYYEDAFNKGAICAILEEESYDTKYNGKNTIILVDNAIDALAKIASYIRDISNSFFVGITGSVGKTCTRNIITSIFREEYNTLTTKGNLNNHIGVPLTMMDIKEEHEVSIIEMGMNHLNEIDYLTKIVRPQIGIITNVGTAHLGNLKSIENILKAKLEILNGMDDNSILIFDNDNDLLHEYFSKNKNVKTLSVGIENESDIMAYDIKTNENSSSFKVKYKNKSFDITLNIPGKELIINALLAIAVSLSYKIPLKSIQKGVENTVFTGDRLERKQKGKITIIADAYNASYASIKLATSVLTLYKNRKILVLGDVFELGEYAEEVHRQIGTLVSSLDIDMYVFIGNDAKYMYEETIKENENVYLFNTLEKANEFLLKNTKDDDVILFKASHGMKFDKLIEQFINN